MSTLHFTLSIIFGYVLVLTFVSAQTYYITPNASDTLCPYEPCLDLTEYANQSHVYNRSPNITLVFLPGTHHLVSDLQIGNISNLILRVAPTNISSPFVAMVTCTSSSRLIFEDIVGVSVSGLEFSGCEGNTVRSVDQLTIEDCTFNDGGHLNLTSIRNGSVLRSSFNSLREEVRGGALYVGGSSIVIHDSSFTNNTALQRRYLSNGGGAMNVQQSKLTIYGSSFTNNTAGGGGGAINVEQSNLTIHKSSFSHNAAVEGGAVFSWEGSDLTIYMSEFSYNTASLNGGAISSWNAGEVTIVTSNFTQNTADRDGGAMSSYQDANVTIDSNSFTHNRAADDGGAIYSLGGGNVTIDSNSFTLNTASEDGGAIYSLGGGGVTIGMSNFTHNTASDDGGAIYSSGSGNVTTFSSTFTNNTANYGGAIGVQRSDLTIDKSSFTQNTATWGITSLGGILTLRTSNFSYNTAGGDGGALNLLRTYGNMIDCSFIDNEAKRSGGAIYVVSSTLDSSGFFHVTNNRAMLGVVFGLQSNLSYFGSTTISNNYGSVYAFSSNVTFGGHTLITNNSPISSNQEGGAVTSFQGEIVLMDTVELTYNQVNNGSGGAISATESKIYSYGDTTIADNTALSGGGIYAYQSELSFNGGTANIRNNTADMRGGGIYAVGTTTKLSGGDLQFIENTAERGGGMCLELNAKLYVTKAEAECLRYDWPRCYTNVQNPDGWLRLEFTNNSADYGGALYVSDDTNSGICSANTEQSTSSECFFQALALHYARGENVHTLNTFFNGNIARKQGGRTIFGGLLDRCTVSPYAEIFKRDQNLSQSTLRATAYISDITDLHLHDYENEISSDPVRVCFCKENQPDCKLQPITLTYEVQKGQAFSVSLVAVDQVKNPVPSTVRASLSSHDGGLGDGQDKQNTTSNCIELTYTVSSPHESEQLVLYADGPCKDIGISHTHIIIKFLPCDCPVGFSASEQQSNCFCDCDPELSDYITSCSISSESVQRKDNIWIAYINTTEQVGYLNYTHCPFDYCKPSTDQVWINLNVPNGADAQCAFNRSGKLCGSCEDGLSLSLGSSRCMSCSNNWLALLIVFAIAGVALVAFLLVCKLTVAVGTINGLIFYANILVTNRATFFPFETPNFFTVFIAWINLDFGFVTCFFDGMDGYSKTWLQLAFPFYLIFLVAMVIIVCSHSYRFARLLSNRNPVATLATLTLISYTKSLRVIIAALSSAALEYPDGSHERLWLTDPNIRYFEGKHIPLFLVALLILVLGIGYTLLLFFWQWLLLCPNRRALKWIKHARFYPFMDTYHAPYTLKHRYWTGLLLFIRVILYLTAALNVGGDPSINLLSISCVLVGLLVLDKLLPGKVYKTWTLNALENSFTFNLIIFSVGSLYVRETGGNQAALAYTSTSIAFITFLAILVYHIYAFVLPKKLKSKLPFHKRQKTQDHNAPIKSPMETCTYSVVEVTPKTQSIENIMGEDDEPELAKEQNDSIKVLMEEPAATCSSDQTTKKKQPYQKLQEIATKDSGLATASDSQANTSNGQVEPKYPTLSSYRLDSATDDIDQKGIDREMELQETLM